MLDDPKKELQRIQEELLAAEEEEWDDLSDIQDLLDDYEEEDSIDALLAEFAEEETPVRNFANSYGKRQSRPVFDYQETDDELDDDAVLYREDARKKGKKKEKGVGGLVFLAILETIGILAIAAWWAMMLL